MNSHTPHSPGRLPAIRRTAIVAGLLCIAVGAANFGSPLIQTASATTTCQNLGSGSVTPFPINPINGSTSVSIVADPSGAANPLLTGGSMTINVDGGSATFTASSNGTVTVAPGATFGGVTIPGSNCTIDGTGATGPGFTATNGPLPGGTSLGTCPIALVQGISLQVLNGNPAGADILSFEVNCGTAGPMLQVKFLASAVGSPTATPEAPSSVLFGGGAALLFLGLGYRARRRKAVRG